MSDGGFTVARSDTQGGRGMLFVTVILLLLWAVAGAVNWNGWLMGGAPTPLGTLVTLVALCAWPAAGRYAGSRSQPGFIRLVLVFWVTVVVGIPLLWWVLAVLPGQSASPGGVAPLVLWLALTAPLYGLVGMLPYQGAPAWSAGVGGAVLLIALGSYLAGRRFVVRPAQADLE